MPLDKHELRIIHSRDQEIIESCFDKYGQELVRIYKPYWISILVDYW